MLGNFGKLMKLAAEMKARVPQMQQRLAESEYTAAAGGGVVAATVNGRMELVGLTIEPSVLSDPAMDAVMLADVTRSAVVAAQAKAATAARDAMKELTGGVELPGLADLLG